MRFKTSLVLAFALAIACGASAYAADPPTKSPDQPSDQERLQAAHERLEQAAREVAELSTKMATVGVPNALTILSHNPNRAMLGIGMGGSRDSDTEGVVVASVSPGGPAAGAGLKAGDVIVELNGKALKRDKDDSSREKLVKEMSKLSPGDEVSLRYTREGKALTTKLKVDRLPQELARREMRMRVLPGERRHGDDFDFDFDFDFPHGPMGMNRGGAFADMELVTLTPKLAQYFGAEKGLLIVHAPEKDLKLEDGDVLVDIDGRVPSNPGHAFRILGSYQTGEKVTLNVMRQRKKSAIAITVPESKMRIERMAVPPRAPHAPVPPTAPSSPLTAPAPVPAAAPPASTT